MFDDSRKPEFIKPAARNMKPNRGKGFIKTPAVMREESQDRNARIAKWGAQSKLGTKPAYFVEVTQGRTVRGLNTELVIPSLKGSCVRRRTGAKK
jgi:hypothetical protein